ncbi:MAG TPA: ornithine carbamoyltransferase [Planctomycetaceae bacterium]|jgi:ornithine carbamoyltransferase|nr:ornithine carbamoyltransferase [Planctomycetaceae bacterium]
MKADRSPRPIKAGPLKSGLPKTDQSNSGPSHSRPAKSRTAKHNSVNRLNNVKPASGHTAGLNGQSGHKKTSGPKVTSAAGRKAKAKSSTRPSPKPGRVKHLTSVFDLTPEDVQDVLAISADLKARLARGDRPPLLQGHVLTLVFEKPSLRTRNSFEAAAIQLGGGSVFLSTQDAGLNGRESLADIARVLSAYSDAIVMRTFRQSLIEEFARLASCPVVNGLSDELHPCQALTDLFTIQEAFGRLAGLRIVYVGDGNNVAASLAMVAAYAKMPITLCSPRGYELSASFLRDVRRRFPEVDLELTDDPFRAVKNADIVYTDVWASMGQESQAEAREKVFASYQVNKTLMAAAPKSARFMHDLPAKRGLEVTDEVMDGPQSIVFRQAENRMHLAKGLLVWLLDEGVPHAT